MGQVAGPDRRRPPADLQIDIDIDLLERNLELTPNDRFVQLQRMLQIYFSRARER